MNNTQEQIKEIFSTHFPKYSDQLDFIDKLGCNQGMCEKFNNNRKFIYQFLPLPVPKSPSEYIFICKEPSTPWAKGTTDAYNKVINKQYMNFISGDRKNNRLDIMITAFRKTFRDRTILITDMSKCAIDTNVADDFGFKENLQHRYSCCAPYLKWEFAKLTTTNPKIFIVGKNYFFVEWYKRKFPEKKNEEQDDVFYFNRFLNDEVKEEVMMDKIFMLPHYSIRFSCPDYILKLLKKDKTKVQKEINEGLKKLYHYYLDNFTLTRNVEKSIKNSLNNIDNTEVKNDLSDSNILLYLLYTNEFEIARERWEKSTV